MVQNPEDPARLSLMARIDAGLERNEDACERPGMPSPSPYCKGCLGRSGLVTSLASFSMDGKARPCARAVGRRREIPAGPSTAISVSPSWDSLRGDPRFESIVESLGPKL